VSSTVDERAYFARPRVLALIFGTFPLITLPLAAILLFPPSPGWRWVSTVYLGALGISHFLITLVIYLSSRNLRYFVATPLNRLIYFGIPAVIFLYFGLAWLVDTVAHPGLGLLLRVVSIVVPLATYTHLGRQSFGVLQILKRQAGLKYPVRSRQLEQTFFFVLPALQAETTFIGEGRFAAHHPLVWITVAVAATLFIAIVVLAVRARRSKPEAPGAVAVPLGYFLIQTMSQCLSVANMRLYLAGDAVHYAEYHTIMYPRLMRSPLGTSSVDRAMALIRRSPALFYAVLLGGSAVAVAFFGDHFGLRTWVDRGPLPFSVVMNMLNGIFLFHFFVEAFIWRFSNPFYRESLTGLYFPKPAAAAR
jgi:hypothetical protein